MLEELPTLIRPDAKPKKYRLDDRLRRLISEQRESFELFRGYYDDESRSEVLEGLPYGESIDRAARRHRLDGLLLAALVEAESNFSPTVVSPVGAVGLTQMMPTTALDYGKTNLEDPATNLDLGARYLKAQLRRFEGNLELALAAYNAGPGAVERHNGVPPYRETERYVEKVLSIYVDHHQSLWHESVEAELLQPL